MSVSTSSIQFKQIISCSSEDRVHCAKNLLENDPTKKWLSAKAGEDRLTCVLELNEPNMIHSVQIGNDGCAFVEILVSKEDDWTILLPPTPLMTPAESRSNTNRNRVRTFQSFDLGRTVINQKWKRLKILCEQKFNRSTQFGLSFIKLNSFDNTDSNSAKTSPLSVNLYHLDDGDEIFKEQHKNDFFFPKSAVVDESRDEKNKTLMKTFPEVPSMLKLSLMKDVHFVLSGFQNPFRSELRKKAIEMGAIYHEDWNEQCTHLICEFAKTPKLLQLQQVGKGSIVNQRWIIDCYDKNQLLPETSYQLKSNSEKSDNNQNRTNDNKSLTIQRKTAMKRKSVQEEDHSIRKEAKQGDLPDFFHGIYFYVSYGDFNDLTLLDIVRIILAYDGIIETQITTNVQYVITKRDWNNDFEKISKKIPEINFISIDWLQDCHDQEKFASTQPYLIIP